MNKIGRNDPCFCGSGKKYKKCHLAKDEEERLVKIYGDSWKEDTLNQYNNLSPEDLVKAYVEAFKNRNFGIIYDLHLEESHFRKKKVSKAAFISEMKASIDPEKFIIESSEIVRSKIEEDKAFVIHKVVIKLGEEEKIMLENYHLTKTEEGWRFLGNQMKEYKKKEEIPSDIDFELFKNLPIN